MATIQKERGYVTNYHIAQAMAACVRLMLDDIRGQYQAVLADADRLKDTGTAAKKVHDELTGLNEWAAKRSGQTANASHRRRRT